MAKKNNKIGKESFIKWYKDLWKERWDSLYKALCKEKKHFELKSGLKKGYFLDEASLYPPKILNPKPGDSVLDICAAPGGKSLVLATILNGIGSLVLNDLSPARRRRLRNVIEEHLDSKKRKIISFISQDGSRLGEKLGETYDKILLDAPCSSERHLIHSEDHLKEWSPGRTRNLSYRQYALIVSAYNLLIPGGILVYSTCSISNKENDEVVKKLIKKKGAILEEIDCKIGEKSSHGLYILPDRCNNNGPIWLSKISKPLDS